ncbi:MAG: Hsp20/alpha crystallin family protein [Desulfuromonas sp.]|nr:Hsp20/alpha crystallin family protein [Desulfuromonas sp.]
MAYLNLMSELDWMQREMNRTLGALGVNQSSDGALNYSFPTIALTEHEDQLVLSAQLPGISADKLEITLEKNLLTIAGERETDAPEATTCHRQERHHGHFERKIKLPLEVERAGISSKLEDGILTLTLPKAEQEKAHRIVVNA